MKSFHKMFNGEATPMFAHVAGESDDLIFVADWNRTIAYVNPAACARTGYEACELLGARMPLLYRRENESRYTSKIFKDLYDAGCSRGELEMRRKDGSTFLTMTHVIAYNDKLGKPSGTLYIAKDLTPAHAAIQRSVGTETLLYRVIESMDDAVCVCDKDGRIRLANSAHCRMLGYSREEILGAKPPYPWSDGCCGDIAAAFKRLKKEGILRNYFTTWTTRERGKINVSVAMAYIDQGDGDLLSHVCTIRDVTDVRYAEELRWANEQLQRLVYDVKQKAVRLKTLEETNLMALRSASAAQIFRRITAAVKQLVRHDLAGFYAYDKTRHALIPHTFSRMTHFSRKLARFPLPMGEGIIGSAATSGDLVWVNNAQLDPRSKYPGSMKPAKEHFIAVPLKGRSSVYGVFVVSRNRDPEFIEEEALVVKSLAEAATVALENAKMSQERPKRSRRRATEQSERSGV